MATGRNHSDTSRIYILDLLRFLAVLTVVFYHYAAKLGCLVDGKTSLFSWSRYGYNSVPILFMISGFVILMSAEGRDWRQFLTSRVCRLYPAFWLCCTLTFVVVLALGKGIVSDRLQHTPAVYLANMTLIPQFLRVRFIDESYWTLEVEIIFYTYIFLILLFSNLRHFEKFLWVWAGISLANIFVANKVLGWVFITEYAPYFILGAICYIASRDGWTFLRGVLTASVVIEGAYEAAIHTEGTAMSASSHNIYAYWTYLIIGLSAFVFVLISLNRIQLKPRTFLLWISNMSYPLYLLHNVLGVFLLACLSGLASESLRIGLVTGLMLVLSAIIWRFVEKPGIRALKQRCSRLLLRLFPVPVQQSRQVTMPNEVAGS